MYENCTLVSSSSCREENLNAYQGEIIPQKFHNVLIFTMFNLKYQDCGNTIMPCYAISFLQLYHNLLTFISFFLNAKLQTGTKRSKTKISI